MFNFEPSIFRGLATGLINHFVRDDPSWQETGIHAVMGSLTNVGYGIGVGLSHLLPGEQDLSTQVIGGGIAGEEMTRQMIKADAFTEFASVGVKLAKELMGGK